MNGVLQPYHGRYALRFERRLSHRPARVWRSLTEPAFLNQWFPAALERLDLRVGGEISFVFPGDAAPPSGGRITELDPPFLLAFTWEGELLRFELSADGDGCRLVFTHVFDDRPGAASFASGWEICLAAMETVLDGRPVEQADNQAALHESYVEAFGLGEGSVEESADGWSVRFDRQMMGPTVEQVWAALIYSAAPEAGAAPPEAFTDPRIEPGKVTALEAPRLLEYEWLDAQRPAGRVRWELSDGPGGARVTLIQLGPRELAHERGVARQAWREHLRRLAEQLRQRAAAGAV